MSILTGALGPQVPAYTSFLSALWAAGCLASQAKPKLVSVFIAFFIPSLRLILQGRLDY